MKKSSAILCAALLATTSLSFAASLTSMSNDQVKQAFFNKTVTTTALPPMNGQSTPDAVVYLDNSGKITGQFVTPPSGQQQQNDQGSYVLKSDGSLCITWQNWNTGKQFCVYAYNTSNSYVLVDNQNNFHGAILKDNIQTGNQLNSAGQMNNTNNNMMDNSNTNSSNNPPNP